MSTCKSCFRFPWLIHVLILIFGAGAWIAVNGVWVELPLIVASAPESWNLPSYLTIIAQVANVGPVIVTVMKIFAPQHYRQNAMIYSILFLGTVGCLLLAFFWDSHVTINGSLRSIPLFILWFVLSFVDCSSSVTFLPYMTTFQTIFLTTYFIGEGLSGFLPSIFALIQGVQDFECIKNPNFNNDTNSTCDLMRQDIPPRFGANVFFVLLCVMMLACSVSFILLNHLGVAKKYYSNASSSNDKSGADNNAYNCNNMELQNFNESTSGPDPSSTVKPDDVISTESKTSNENGKLTAENSETVTLSVKNYVYLLGVIAFTNALSNGVLPAVSSYSSLPYGPITYHLSASLGNMANPIACIIAIFLPMRSFWGIGGCTIFATGWGAYLLSLAATSPCPVLVYDDAGKALMVLAQILFVGVGSYVKVSIAQIFRSRGHPNSLVWYGAVVQAGSLVGAVIMFPLVNVLDLFKQFYNPCCEKCPLA